MRDVARLALPLVDWCAVDVFFAGCSDAGSLPHAALVLSRTGIIITVWCHVFLCLPLCRFATAVRRLCDAEKIDSEPNVWDVSSCCDVVRCGGAARTLCAPMHCIIL